MNRGIPFLLISTLTDAVWNICLKRSKGLADLPVNITGAVFLFIGIIAFKNSLSYFSLSVATVIWSGTSLSLTIILDYYLFNTRLDAKTIFFICLCILSSAGLNFSSGK